jgi:membrane protein DedA with SNARE-associated domain
MPIASITDSLVTLATHVINDLGLAGVFLLTLTSSTIGLPGTEPTMLFAGFNLNLPGIIVAGVLGDVTGASIAFAIGYYGRVELIERHGNKLHISPRRLALAHSWFERYGDPAIFFSRLIPVVRAVFPYAAGVAEMSFKRFLMLATAGSIIWISGLAILGHAVGSHWSTWRHHLEILDYVGLALVIGAVVWFGVRWWRGRGGGPGARTRDDGERTADSREQAADVTA